MRVFRAVEKHNGNQRMYSFYTKRERDEFIAEDVKHRIIPVYITKTYNTKYKPLFVGNGGRHIHGRPNNTDISRGGQG